MSKSKSDSVKVIFERNWCQTLPPGTMIDHKAGPAPVRLLRAVAERAIADGAAKPAPANKKKRTGETVDGAKQD